MTDEFLTIASFPSIAAAELARSDLEQAGIRANYFESNGFMSGHGVQLQVAAADAEPALAVLAESEKHAKHHANHGRHFHDLGIASSAANENSPECYEDQSPREKAADRAFFLAFVAMAVPPLAFYVGWQLGIVIVSRQRLSATMRKFAIWTGVLLLVDIGILILWLRSF